MAQQATLPGFVDESELKQLDQSLEGEQSSFANYMTVRELSWLSRCSPGRIYNALHFSKTRRLTGIKRGIQWFILRDDALRWAHETAVWEHERWGRNLKRIERAMRIRDIMVNPMPYAQPKRAYDPPPEGMKVYTIDEAAAVLQTTKQTMYVYLSKGGALQNTARFIRWNDRVKVYEARPIDIYLTQTRRLGHLSDTRGTTFKRDSDHRPIRLVPDGDAKPEEGTETA